MFPPDQPAALGIGCVICDSRRSFPLDSKKETRLEIPMMVPLKERRQIVSRNICFTSVTLVKPSRRTCYDRFDIRSKFRSQTPKNLNVDSKITCADRQTRSFIYIDWSTINPIQLARNFLAIYLTYFSSFSINFNHAVSQSTITL